MTTLDIGRLHINNPNIKNKTLDEIKVFLTQVLESDLVSNMSTKRKTRWDRVDNELRNLEVVNIVPFINSSFKKGEPWMSFSFRVFLKSPLLSWFILKKSIASRIW